MRIDRMAYGRKAFPEWRRLNDPQGTTRYNTLDNWNDTRYGTVAAAPNRLPEHNALAAQGKFLNDKRPSLCYVANSHQHLLEWELPAITLSW